MQEVVKINNNNLQIKTWNGQRVVTLADIDMVHERPIGTAKKNFQNNRKHFIIGADYFEITRKELREKFSPNSEPLKGNPNITSYLFTESGYLMLVKSFTDDLAWKVQRDLVNCYFKLKEIQPQAMEALMIKQDFKILCEQINSMEAVLDYQHEKFKDMCIYLTINYQQQQELLKEVRERVNYLLGGAHSPAFKKLSRTYYKNLWLGLCKKFRCGTYKDLRPEYMADAKNYIRQWNYINK